METDASQEEIDAIANFYALQSSGRENERMLKRSDEAKQKIVASLMRDLDDYAALNVGSPLLLVEELRSGKIIWKGGFAPTDAQGSRWMDWWQQRGAAQVKILYRKWWSSGSSWKQKQARNPLASSGIETIGP